MPCKTQNKTENKNPDISIAIGDDGAELTPCCGAYSTYYDTELVCKVCYELV